MPFWKKSFSKRTGVYYPQAIVQRKPVETETIAKDLARISTVSNSDVQAVLGDISGVMHTCRAEAVARTRIRWADSRVGNFTGDANFRDWGCASFLLQDAGLLFRGCASSVSQMRTYCLKDAHLLDGCCGSAP